MSLCRLVYKSKTSWDIINNEVLRRLAEKSTLNNTANDITGLLVLSDETFLQVLEGPDHAVNGLYAKILANEMHHDVTLLGYEQAARRSFDHWSMRVVDLNDLAMSPRELFRKKYQDREGYIEVPDDVLGALSLLFDAQALCLAEAC